MDLSVALGFKRTTRRSPACAVDGPRTACGHRTRTEPCFECFYRANVAELTTWATRSCGVYTVMDAAEDVLADAVADLLAHWSPDIRNPRAYLHTAVRHKACDVALGRGLGKGRARREDEVFDPDRHTGGVGADPASVVLLTEVRDALAAALLALPRVEREVVECRLVTELSTAETAEFLAMEPNAVTSALFRGRAKLRRLLPPDLLDRADDRDVPHHHEGGDQG